MGRILGWIVVPYVMVFTQWKRLSGRARVAGSLWAAFAVIAIIVSMSNSNSKDSGKPLASSPPTSKPTTSADVKSSNTSAKPTQTKKPPVNVQDTNFLKAVNDIAYNTFTEASNVGDQMHQLGALQESYSDFSDFMGTDKVVWDLYLKEITANTPSDSFLLDTQQQIKQSLTELSKDAASMSQAANSKDANKIVTIGEDMTVQFNKLKQFYSQAVSQMPQHGIDPNWTPGQ